MDGRAKSTDGPTGGWSCVFGVAAMGAVATSPQLLDVVWCSAVLVLVVAHRNRAVLAMWCN